MTTIDACLKMLLAGTVLVGATAATVRPDDVLWLGKPAARWEREALPLGNGRLGGMLFGGVKQEHIQFNVDRLWTGNENPDGGYGDGMGFYQNFGDLFIDLDGGATNTAYRRELDLGRAVSRVRYTRGGVTFVRETFCSRPDQVLVSRMTASAKGQYSGRIRLVGAHGDETAAANNRLAFAGTLSNGMAYEAQVLVTAEGGTIKPDGDALVFSRCDGLTLTLGAGTGYAMDYAKGWKGPNPHARVTEQVDAAAKRAWSTLLERHVADHRSLYDRVTLDLGTTEAAQRALPMDERLKAMRAGAGDPELEALMFQYGRYLLIASSRPGTLPANLQGIWNNSNHPPWHADYHSNINVEMCYWPAEVANLAECHTPLFDLLDACRDPFRKATRKDFGEQIRGFTIRTSHNPFGGMGWRWNQPASAWYARHFWDHYTFSGDKQFLATEAYPYLKEVSEFWGDHLKELPDHRLVVPQGWSPEHGPTEDGVSYDQEIVWDVFNNTIQAAQILGVDADFAKKLAGLRDRLVGPRIGKWGQLQEWMEDRDDPNDHHRHLSHLFALYPGREIDLADTPKWAAAARTSLAARGEGGTGWSLAWKISLWARLQDGNHAYAELHNLEAGHFCDNLFDGIFGRRHPFQIDGNFGYTAGVAEMLLQSRLPVVKDSRVQGPHAPSTPSPKERHMPGPDNPSPRIQLLPALPDAWKTGSVTGLRARGGVTVDMNWREGRLIEATLHSSAGGAYQLVYGGGSAVVTIEPGNEATVRPRDFGDRF